MAMTEIGVRKPDVEKKKKKSGPKSISVPNITETSVGGNQNTKTTKELARQNAPRRKLGPQKPGREYTPDDREAGVMLLQELREKDYSPLDFASDVYRYPGRLYDSADQMVRDLITTGSTAASNVARGEVPLPGVTLNDIGRAYWEDISDPVGYANRNPAGALLDLAGFGIGAMRAPARIAQAAGKVDDIVKAARRIQYHPTTHDALQYLYNKTGAYEGIGDDLPTAPDPTYKPKYGSIDERMRAQKNAQRVPEPIEKYGAPPELEDIRDLADEEIPYDPSISRTLEANRRVEANEAYARKYGRPVFGGEPINYTQPANPPGWWQGMIDEKPIGPRNDFDAYGWGEGNPRAGRWDEDFEPYDASPTVLDEILADPMLAPGVAGRSSGDEIAKLEARLARGNLSEKNRKAVEQQLRILRGGQKRMEAARVRARESDIGRGTRPDLANKRVWTGDPSKTPEGYVSYEEAFPERVARRRDVQAEQAARGGIDEAGEAAAQEDFAARLNQQADDLNASAPSGGESTSEMAERLGIDLSPGRRLQPDWPEAPTKHGPIDEYRPKPRPGRRSLRERQAPPKPPAKKDQPLEWSPEPEHYPLPSRSPYSFSNRELDRIDAYIDTIAKKMRREQDNPLMTPEQADELEEALRARRNPPDESIATGERPPAPWEPQVGKPGEKERLPDMTIPGERVERRNKSINPYTRGQEDYRPGAGLDYENFGNPPFRWQEGDWDIRIREALPERVGRGPDYVPPPDELADVIRDAADELWGTFQTQADREEFMRRVMNLIYRGPLPY